MNKSFLQTVLSAGVAIFLAAALIVFPKESLDASVRGLDMWWGVVFPSLLPFFIASEILIGFGVVKFVGVLLEPLMRPVFRVPGVGGFAWAMGLATGFPAGAKLTARLRQEKQLTKIEAERLVAFTNSSNPLFLFGVVAVGFFHNPQLGILIALSHYIGNICVGLVMRYYGGSKKAGTTDKTKKSKGFLLKDAFLKLHKTRMEDKRPLGSVLGDAVTSSIQTLLMVGGFIILFSVLNELLSVLGITELLSFVIGGIFQLLQLPTDLSIPFISGVFEITNGSQLTSDVESVSLLSQMVIVSFILGFNGLSIHAQVASILGDTDIRYFPFFIGRIFHGLFASVFVFLLWKPLYESRQTWNFEDIPVFSEGTVEVLPFWSDYWQWLVQNGSLVSLSCLAIYTLTLMISSLKRAG